MSARRLLGASEAYAMDEAETAVWQELGERLRVKLPEVRSSEQISSPVVVGLLSPVLLLPEAFAECAEAERRAALCHELAHIQRRDCLVHAVCQAMALPLVWHPLVEGVQRKIARTREMVCDGIAAREMRSDVAYARCLLGLAQGMLRAGAPRFAGEGLGLFRSNKLEERVMRLTEAKQTMSVRETWVRRVGGTAAMGGALMAAGMFHLTPVMAQAGGSAAPMNFLQPIAPVAHTAPLAPLAPIAPVAPVAAMAPAAPIQALVGTEPLSSLAPLVQTAAPAPQAAPAPLAPLAPLPAPAPAPAPAPFAPLVQSSGSGSGSGASSSPGVTFSGDEQEIVDGDQSIAIAHGKNGHLMIRDGMHVHRWMGADGQPFELMNNQVAELTPQQQREAEAEYKQKLENAQKELAKVKLKLDSPEFKLQMEKLSNGEWNKEWEKSQKQMAEQLAKMKGQDWQRQMKQFSDGTFSKQMAESQAKMAQELAKINSPEWKLQMKQFSDGTFSKQMAEDQAKMAQQLAKIDSKDWQLKTQKQVADALATLESAELKKQMAEAEREAKLANSPEMKAKLDAARRQVEAAAKQMEEAQQAMERAQREIQKAIEK